MTKFKYALLMSVYKYISYTKVSNFAPQKPYTV